MAAGAVTFMTVEAQPTAVVAQTTTWTEFPKLWGPLLGQVYEFVRPHPELATGAGDELWQNVMLYKDQRPDVEIGVLASGTFQAEGPVIPSVLPGGEVATATHRGDYAKLGVTHEAVRDYAAAHGRELRRPVLGDLRPCAAGPDRRRDRSLLAAPLKGGVTVTGLGRRCSAASAAVCPHGSSGPLACSAWTASGGRMPPSADTVRAGRHAQNGRLFTQVGRSMSWSATDIPDQSGRVAVVTGANGGLGLETTRELARRGAHVVMAVRDQQRAREAVLDIRRGVSDAALQLVSLDLASQASARAAAEQILHEHQGIDLLVNNAGVMGIPERRTVDGYEMQLGVDHLGHWTLTALLLPALLRSPDARIVTVTSTAHHMGRPVDPGNPHLVGRYRPWRAYGQAKLANFHFGLGLQRELARAGASAASLLAHPGLSNTELQAVSVRETGGGTSQRFFLMLARRTGMSPAQGALSQLRAATDPHAKGGDLYGPIFVTTGAPVRKPILRRAGMNGAIAKLWAVSERETGVAMALR